MSKLKITKTDDDKDRMPCPKCSQHHALSCGYLEYYPANMVHNGEHDCVFQWEETLAEDSPTCEECPLLWCMHCQAEAIVNWSLVRLAYPPIKEMPDDMKEHFECFAPKETAAKIINDTCEGDGWYRCPECMYFEAKTK